MSITHTYDKEKKVLIIHLEGEIKVDDVNQLYKDIVSSTEFPPDIRSIWDFRKADFSTVNKDFFKKVFSIRKNYPERGTTKAAFVADKDLSFGMSRMYEILSSFELPQHIKTYRDFSEAEAWVLETE